MLRRTVLPVVVLLLMAGWPAEAFRGEGSQRFRQGLAYLESDGDARVLGESEARRLSLLGDGERLALALTHLEQARGLALGAGDLDRVDSALLRAHRELAGWLEAEGRLAEAARHLARARDLSPGDRRLDLAAARLAARQGLHPEAIRGFRVLLAGVEEASEQVMLARELAAVQEASRPGPVGAEAAERELAACLASRPDLVEAASRADRALRELFLDLGRLRFALRRYEAAGEAFRWAGASGPLPPDRHREAELAATFAARRPLGEVTEAHPDGHFRIEIAGEVASRRAEVLRQLFEEARAEVGTALDVFPASTLAVQVLLDADYRALIAHHSEALSHASGLVLRLHPEADTESLRPVVFHEYAHAAIRARMGEREAPRFVHEGIATCLEPGGPGLEWYRVVLSALRRKALPSAGELAGFVAVDTRRLSELYGTSALFFAWLSEREGPAVLARLVARLAAGDGLEQAFPAAAGAGLGELYRVWGQELVEQVRARLVAERQRGEPGPSPEPGDGDP